MSNANGFISGVRDELIKATAEGYGGLEVVEITEQNTFSMGGMIVQETSGGINLLFGFGESDPKTMSVDIAIPQRPVSFKQWVNVILAIYNADKE